MKSLVPGIVIGLAVLASAVPWRAASRERLAAPAGTASRGREPEGPRATVDTTIPAAQRVVRVPAGSSLQAALDQARPGDTFALDAGAVYKGPFTLPRNPGDGWIVVRSGSANAGLPGHGTRIDPQHAGPLPVLESASGPVIQTASGASRYRLIGLEIRPAAGVFLQNLVVLGGLEATPGLQPGDIVIDRCYIHGDPKVGSRRGIALNSRSTAIVESWLSDFKEVGQEAQAIAGWDGPGPYTIADNYLEAAGENVIFGGSTPSVKDLVPSDIVIRDNLFRKPMSWHEGDPSFAGTAWDVKNLLELKNARRVLIQHNVMENNWVKAQNGFAILFTVRTERGTAPWAVIEDVRFEGNVVRHSAAGVNILGVDDTSPDAGGRTTHVAIRQNLFLDIGAPELGGSGILFQILNGADGVTIDHNTALHTGNIISADLQPSPAFEFTNNIVEHNTYGVIGSGTGPGRPALDHYLPGYVFRRNVIVGAPDPRIYPSDNFFPATLGKVGFTDAGSGQYQLSARSAYHGRATDGADVGVNVSNLAPFTDVRTADRRD